MINRFMEDRAPLEFTKPSTKTMIIVCPNCKAGQYKGTDWFSGECSNCHKYFRKDDSLTEDEMEDMSETSTGARNIDGKNSAGIKLREKTEKQANEYKTKVQNLVKTGKQRHHEPDNLARKW